MAQMPCEESRRRGAVHIVITENRNLFATRRGLRDPDRRRLHLRDGVRIRHQLTDGGIEKVLDCINIDATACNDACEHLR